MDDHLAAVGPEVVLGEISRVAFTSFDWRHELIRSKPTVADRQGHVYPVLANAITALRYAPEWKGVLALNEFDLMPVVVRTTPWGSLASIEWRVGTLGTIALILRKRPVSTAWR